MTTRHYLTTRGTWLYLSILLLWCTPVLSDQKPLIEEIIVTAQRIEQSANDVPMSVSAFTEAMIRDRQTIGVSDLQINVPNLSYTVENFGGSRISIRGIGDLFGGGEASRMSTGPSVPVHINGVSAPIEVSVHEFYDLERVEVMRGPQGTLYGRMATAGAMNLVTRRPDTEAFGGYVDLEYGDYDHVRGQLAVNVPISDELAFRVAGMMLERDGYIDNKAADQIPGIDDDMDGRDTEAYRITGQWQPSEDLTMWVMYSRMEEDDSRVRISNQVCQQSTLPNVGCDPEAFGLEPVNPGAIFATIVAGQAGLIPPGAVDEATGLEYPISRPRLGLREQHSDFNPLFEFDEEAWLLGVDWIPGSVGVHLSASHYETSYLSQQDYLMDVGYRLNPTAQNPSGLWPTSAPSGGPGAFRGGGQCDVESYRAGVAGGCTFNADLDRLFAFDQAGEEREFWSVELRVQSDWDGRFNFLVGTSYLETEVEADHYVMSNAFDAVGQYGAGPLLGPGFWLPPLYPSFFNDGAHQEVETFSVFGELYFSLAENAKLTLGARYSDDQIKRNGARALFSSYDANVFIPLGTEPIWIRNALASHVDNFFGIGPPTPEAVALADYYAATDAITATNTLPELYAALQIVPAAERLEEFSGLNGRPDEVDYDNVSVRAVLDWAVNDNTLVFASFSQGYRPGGLNQVFSTDATAEYDREKVDAYEIGIKSLLLGGSLSLNAAVFYNDHKDLHLWQWASPDVFIANVDARSTGFELDTIWQPAALPSLAVEFSYSWLDAEFTNGRPIDQLNRTQDDPNFVNLKTPFADGYVARVEDVLPWLPVIAAVPGAAFPEWGTYENGIPVYLSPDVLNFLGVPTSRGVSADLDGNELPNSPPHTVHLGVAHTWPLRAGALTLRYDYYWQDQNYGREFNTRGDRVESWDQHNASAVFESADGRWSARAWVRNITDEEIVTGHWVASDNSGSFRNYFMAEPRIYGASLRYNFGVL